MARRDEELQRLLHEVRRIRVQSARLVRGALAGGYRSVFRGTGIEFEEVREYVEGDDPRAVDWNVTARMGRPFIKKYVDDRQLNLAFLLDLSPSMSTASSAWSPRQMAARVCACLMLAAVHHDDRVAFLGYGNEVIRFERPRKGIEHVMRIVRDFLELPEAARAADPAVALEQATRQLPKHSAVFVVSDFLGGGWQPALQQCAEHHEVVAMRLLAPELQALPRGMWRCGEPGGSGQRVVDGSDPKVQQGYRLAVEQWDADCRQLFRQAGVARLDVPIPEDEDPDAIARPLLRFFRTRTGGTRTGGGRAR